MRHFLPILLLICIQVQAKESRWTPEILNPLERITLYNTFDCPYPVSADGYDLTVDGNTVRIVEYSGGNICFDGHYVDLEQSYDFGFLPAGEYTLEYIVTGFPTGPLPPPQIVQFSVVDTLPVMVSGQWQDPTRAGHGFSIFITPDNKIVVYWNTYTAFGDQLWLIATGDNDGTTVTLPAYRTRGMVFNEFDPSTLLVSQWGTLTLSFDSCTTATVTWEPAANTIGFAPGSATINQFSGVGQAECDI